MRQRHGWRVDDESDEQLEEVTRVGVDDEKYMLEEDLRSSKEWWTRGCHRSKMWRTTSCS